jgi:hypothetical protein
MPFHCPNPASSTSSLRCFIELPPDLSSSFFLPSLDPSQNRLAVEMAEASTSSLSAEQRESMNAKRLAGALPLRLRNKIGQRAKGS